MNYIQSYWNLVYHSFRFSKINKEDTGSKNILHQFLIKNPLKNKLK